MSGVLPPTPGQLVVVSKLEEEVLGETAAGLTGTVDGIMLAGGLMVSLLGLTAGPPEERLDSSLNSDT